MRDQTRIRSCPSRVDSSVSLFTSPVSTLLAVCCLFFASLFASPQSQAADLAEATAALYSGDYDKCIEITKAEVDRGVWNDAWAKLLIRTYILKGQYEEAVAVWTSTSSKFSSSMPLRLLGVEALRYAGKDAEAKVLLDQIPVLLESAPWRFSDRDNAVALGRYFLDSGEDAREVLDLFYDRALKADPKFVEAHIATAELALSKNDYQEAVKSLKAAEKLRPEDPTIFYLLAKAWAPSNGEAANAALEQAVKLNPKHVESILLQCEELLDGERYKEADEMIGKVLEINPKHWKAFALRAVIAHMRGQYREEGELRKKALSTWSTNPAVDFEIGKKLSRFYRFEEAIKYERRALMLDPVYVPARFQLAQDLLRTGAIDEGWMIVDQVTQADKYNVVASNLRTLRNRLEQFATLEAPGFIIRMDARESRIYGQRVVKLLTEARKVLCEKYDWKLNEPVTVEIFPQQSDFAIRTFGLPGGAGFLGVCFGKLITANSPASQGDSPSNWESVLWHEFCHVVTLQKTNNRMPRWLSEGISVYEELEHDRSWGQSMTPTYREMLLGDDFVPLSKLSSAFLQPKTPMHLQFAYFESSLAVRYMVEEHGLERLKKLLVDLGAGVPMEDALGRNYGDREVLDADFKKYVEKKANSLFKKSPSDAGSSSKDKPDEDTPEIPPRVTVDELKKLFTERPNDYAIGRLLARKLISSEEWDEAKQVLDRLDQLWSEDAESGGTLEMLALVYQQLKDSAGERKVLDRIVSLSSDSVSVLERLIDVTRAGEEWDALQVAGEKLLAVQPLIAKGHMAVVDAARHRNRPVEVADALSSLLELDPIDLPKLHFELAEARLEADQLDEARREVLLALEETPRYRAAQQLLLKIAAKRTEKAKPKSDSATLASPNLAATPDEGEPPRPPKQ